MALDSQSLSPPVLILYGSQKGQAHAIAEEVLETARQEFSLEADISCLSQPDIIIMALDSQSLSPPVLILYGSQKGQAHAIAEEVLETARQEFSLEADISCLSQPDIIERLRIGGFVVFIVSTTGEGEPPDTMRKFWRSIKRKDLSSNYFSNLRYALLGLGDSNYANFCAMGKNLNQRLLSLGAEPFYEAGFADDGTGLEVVVDQWVDNIWQAFRAYTKEMSKNAKQFPNECTPLLHEMLHESLSPSNPATKSPSTTNNLDKVIALQRHNSLPEKGGYSTSVSSNESLLPDESPNGLTLIGVKHSLTPTPTRKLSPFDYSASSASNSNSSAADSLDELSTLASKLLIDQQVDTDEGSSFLTASNSKVDVEIPLMSQSTVYANANTFQPNSLPRDSGSNSITVSSPTHSEEKLSTPSDQPHHLECEILSAAESCPEFRTQPIFPNDTISICDILSSRLLTDTQRFSDVNRVIEMELLMNDPFGFQAGDAVGVLCPNDELEVNYLLERLDLRSVADSLLKITILPFTSKKGAIVPAYIPTKCTVRELFLHHLDIRSVPRKSLLWMLAQYTSNREEKYRLAKLSSKQGSEEYTTLIRDQAGTLMDILHSFPSCNPPLVRLIEFLQPLNPRYYSICNSPITSDNRIKIVFSVVALESKSWHPSKRIGLCTGWMDTLSTRFINESIKPKLHLSIISRMFNSFHLPEDPTTPIIMVGPGTGVAPFIGFLEHREHLRNQGKELGPSLLFFGCRHEEGDLLFKEELEKFQASSILSKLYLSFSRDESSPARYVQDNMTVCGSELLRLVRDEKAVFYLCGDAKNMAPDVRQTWLNILQKHGEMDKEEATLYIKELQKEKRYLQDIWL